MQKNVFFICVVEKKTVTLPLICGGMRVLLARIAKIITIIPKNMIIPDTHINNMFTKLFN